MSNQKPSIVVRLASQTYGFAHSCLDHAKTKAIQAVDSRQAWTVRLFTALAALLFVLFLIGLILPALSHLKSSTAKMKPAANLRGTLQSMVVFSNSNNGFFPGLNTQGEVTAPGVRFTGSAMNTGAAPSSRYWMLLSGKYLGADLLINPIEYPDERKSKSGMKKWIAGQAVTTNNFSYAMLQIAGSATATSTRGCAGRAAEWNHNANERAILMADRNTGINNCDAAVCSVWTKSAGDWRGTIAWGDGSVDMPGSNTGFKTRYNGIFDGDDNLFSALPAVGVEEAATVADSNAMMVYE